MPSHPLKQTVTLQAIPSPMVLIPAETGVWYEHQYAGSECHHAVIEGFLVPALDALECVPILTADVEKAINLVPQIFIWVDDKRIALEFDVEQARFLRVQNLGGLEAFVPVKTPFGPGWLIWENSD